MKRHFLFLICSLFILSGCTSVKKMLMIMGSNPQENNPQAIALGEAIYQQHCLQCHGIKGEGKGPLASSLSSPVANLKELASKKSEKSFAANTKYGKRKDMPPFKGTLTDDEIWQVAIYVKSFEKK